MQRFYEEMSRPQEEQGLVCYLRPSYQNPRGGDQTTLDILAPAKQTRKIPQKHPWPKPLLERMQAVQHLLATEHGPFTAADLAARFSRAKPEQMAPLLATLEILGLV